MASSLAVDESSDIRGDSSLNVTEEFLALRPVHGTTTGQDLYEEVSRCGNEMELPREKLVGWTTDGAPAMCGHRSGLVAKIREKMQEEKVTAELTAHHCIIHLESLCAEALNMEHGMFTITHAGNFIRAKGLIQRPFKAFLSQWQTQRGDLPHHTEAEVESSAPKLQMEVIELQCSDALKATHGAVGAAEFARFLPDTHPGCSNVACVGQHRPAGTTAFFDEAEQNITQKWTSC
ncbi:hypothetical protein D4764_02G0001200 [Takifugu flavidus]|uniref:Protein FAM200B n=1 Tax=Takifugu flavidus TaxID=433684 RepID=A0A5C6NKB9_9TELE|nr:hypothetical protein D4764_02G0001200 [Takifugu flavidus]